MKTTYIKPTALVVKLQQQGLVCTSVHNMSTNSEVGISYGGSSSNDVSGQDPRAKESVNVWDEDW